MAPDTIYLDQILLKVQSKQVKEATLFKHRLATQKRHPLEAYSKIKTINFLM
jgi:hypothetical protein